MTEDFDLFDEMAVELDNLTLEAILVGGAGAGDLPPSLQRVAALVELSRSSTARGELAGEDDTVAAMTAAFAAAADDVEMARRRRVKRRAMQGVAVGAFVLLTGTAAAAANRLPDSVQDAVASAGEHVGLHLPKGKNHAKHDSSDTGDSTASDHGNGPDATGPAKAGLCTAHAARGSNASANAGGVAERNLESAAGSAGQTVDEFCAGSTHGSSTKSHDSSDGDETTESETQHSADPQSSNGVGPASNNSGGADSAETSTHSSSGKKPESSSS